jgi:alpha-ketoglutarate-dependent taurine dioxygenase
MKTRALKNYGASVGLEVYDIDLESDAEILELGRIVGEQNVVYVKQRIDTRRLFNIMTQWGRPSASLIHRYVLEKRLEGRHWREIFFNLGLISKQLGDEMEMAAIVVSPRSDDKNRPIGIFNQGELDWHADQCALDDSPRVIGLQSVEYSANSQTQFLCTHDAYESLSSDMKSMVQELICVHKWQDNKMAPGLNEMQSLVIHYNMVPLNGMETKLFSESCAGLPGIKFPSHSFDHFRGMSTAESQRVIRELQAAIYQDQYVYTQDWEDGEIVFMDQEITLHKRPTDVTNGSKRTMSRVITYMDKLYPTKTPTNTVRYNGHQLSHEEFAKLVDEDRKHFFEEQQNGEYADPVRPFAY